MVYRVSILALLVTTAALGCGDQADTEPGGRFDEINDAPTKGDPAKGGAEAPAEAPTDAKPAPPSDPGAPATAPPATSNTCQTARDLGAMSGDSGTGSISAKGKCSEWLRVRVTENDGWAWANNLKLTATLVPPDGSDFDLHLYVNKTSDVLECATATAKSEQPASRSDIATAEWGEAYTGNLTDDGRTVSIEIRSKNGQCANEPWTLLLQGNL